MRRRTLARRARGKTQSWAAGKAGISPATLAQFEMGRPAISAGTMRRIAPILNINPAYVDDPSVNRFFSKDLIRMELPLATAGGAILEVVCFLVERNSVLRLLLLVSDTRLARKSLRGTGSRVVAVASQDGDGNVFLMSLRRRLSAAWEEGLKRIAKVETGGKFVEVEEKAVSDDLFLKIANGGALKEDIARLFHAGYCILTVSDDERKVLAKMRETGISASAVLDLMERSQ